MTDLFTPYTMRFNTITLDELNDRAALLNREENKYIVSSEDFFKLIDDLVQNFDILRIEDSDVFGYKSTYFDSNDLIGYAYHNQGRTKRRFKVRTRLYVESGLCYFEVKLKNKRGGTIKKRIPYAISDYGMMTEQAKQFLKDTYYEVYGHPFPYHLESQMEVSYSRITLVAKAGGERMTIDFNLSFENPEQITPVRSMLIVETKSATGRGIGDATFKKHGFKPRSCSKYCLGANLLQYKVKYNHFKPLLKLYSSLPLYAQQSAAFRAQIKPVRRARTSVQRSFLAVDVVKATH